MGRIRCTLAAIVASVSLLALPAPADENGPVVDEVVRECAELNPVTIGAAGATDDGARIRLDVAVVTDGVTPQVALAAAVRAADAYRPLGLHLRVVRQVAAAFPGDGSERGPDGVTRPTISEVDVVRRAKAVFGGRRPPGTDLVFVLTTKNIYAGGPDGARDYGVGGIADCIGGVRFADRAFAAGEVLGPRTFGAIRSDLGTATVMAHEVGHLMGAHHHYAECATGVADEVTAPQATPCTLMITDVGLASLSFSVTNGLMVRGHAAHWARP